MIKIVSALILATFFMSNMALAEGQKLKQKLSQGVITISVEVHGCDDDRNKYCPGLEKGSQKAFMCMMAYEDKISSKCKQGVAEAAMAMRMGAAAINYSISACETDADKFCLDVEPGEGRLLACLKKNKAQVSKQCITALKETGFWDSK